MVEEFIAMFVMFEFRVVGALFIYLLRGKKYVVQNVVCLTSRNLLACLQMEVGCKRADPITGLE